MSLVAHALSLVVLVGGDPQVPRVEITPILHTGDPAPGLPGATMVYFLPPQIDGAGNVLIDAFYSSGGESSAGRGLWYGPPGALQLISFTGMQAPDLAPGVVIDFTGDTWLAENGWIGFSGHLSGPGVVSGVNDIANFIGPPGDIRKVLRGADSAPGLEPGTVIDVSSGNGLTPWLSDNATLLVIAWLAGPQVDETNDQAIWIGPRDDLQLIWRKGTEAPGTNGARFAWADGIKFNDNDEIAFRGGLVREGDIDHTNDAGIWAGAPNGMELVIRQGDRPWGMKQGVFVPGTGMGIPALNAHGDLAFGLPLAGDGVTDSNDWSNWIVADGEPRLIVRAGDPVPGLAPDIVFAFAAAERLSQSRVLAFDARFLGNVPLSEDRALFVGGYDSMAIGLREGDPVVGQGGASVYTNLIFAGGRGASNDVGDQMFMVGFQDPQVSEQDIAALALRDHRTGLTYPLVYAGADLGGRTVSLPSPGDGGSIAWWRSGGSDGQWQSFNDNRELAIRLEFENGTHGVFLAHPPAAGDADQNGVLDLNDYAEMFACTGGPGISPSSDDCTVFDIDWDDDVDLLDLGWLQVLFGGSD